MRKLKLDLDSLDVLTFAPASYPTAGGTVAGHVADMVLTENPCRSVNYSCYSCYCIPSLPCPTH